jgi:hypothetical protein
MPLIECKKFGINVLSTWRTLMTELCCIKGCDRQVLAMGMCVNHWRNNKRNGSPVAPRPLSAENQGLSDEERFWKSVKKLPTGCWEWQAGRDKDGYGVFAATVFGVRVRRAHRFSHMLHSGELLNHRILVLHSCDNPPCVNPAHLSSGTNADNVRDMIAKGRDLPMRKAQSAKVSKLTDEQVVAILRDPRHYDEIALEYGVHKQHVKDIKGRRTRLFVEINESEIIRHKRGAEGARRSKNLTEADVRAIRASIEKGVTLAARYGVSVATISQIRHRASWKDIA